MNTQQDSRTRSAGLRRTTESEVAGLVGFRHRYSFNVNLVHGLKGPAFKQVFFTISRSLFPSIY